ncbi:MAG TPA: hypothetical protein VMV70_08315 [Gallionella sp.]|nr:hypothetical protein [Gallionella sp.]
MLRTFARFICFIGNYRHYRHYRHYRGNGLNAKSAWDLAIMTLPQPAKNRERCAGNT